MALQQPFRQRAVLPAVEGDHLAAVQQPAGDRLLPESKIEDLLKLLQLLSRGLSLDDAEVGLVWLGLLERLGFDSSSFFLAAIR